MMRCAGLELSASAKQLNNICVYLCKGAVVNQFNKDLDKLRAASMRPKGSVPAKPGTAGARLGRAAPVAGGTDQKQQPGLSLPAKPIASDSVQSNGFSAAESKILHAAIELAGLRWFDGDSLVMGKKDDFEVFFRPGQSASARWLVMGFPLYDMNLPNSAEVCLHFMAESFNMIHMLDFQYHVGINMETEILEFLVQLPLVGVDAPQLGELIKAFFETLSESVMSELSKILEEMQESR